MGGRQSRGCHLCLSKPGELAMNFISKWIKMYCSGKMATKQKVLSDSHITKKKIELAVTFFVLRCPALLFLAMEIKTNFDLFQPEPDENIKARILPLILFVISRLYPMDPWLL